MASSCQWSPDDPSAQADLFGRVKFLNRATDKHAIIQVLPGQMGNLSQRPWAKGESRADFSSKVFPEICGRLRKILRPHASLRQRRFNLKKANSAL